MATGHFSRLLTAAFLILILAFLVTSRLSAQLIVYVDSVQTAQDNDSIVIEVMIDNFSGDSITGYTLWLSISNPDYIGFWSDSMRVIDTTYSNCLKDSCVLWNGETCIFYTCLSWGDTAIDTSWVQRGALDVTGTLSANWDFVDAAILDSRNAVIKINAIADNGGAYTPGIPSPTSQGILCRLVAGVKESPDTCPRVVGIDTTWVPCCFNSDTSWLPWDSCFCDSNISLILDNSKTNFSNPEGQFIGWLWSDTAWICVMVPPDGHQECVRKCVRNIPPNIHCHDSACAYSYGGFCYLWECTDCDVWDSAGYIDPDMLYLMDGAVQIECTSYVCGDANADGSVDVSDAVWIINYVFVGGLPPQPLMSGEVNCDGSVDVSDAVWIINYVFVGGAAPCDC